MPKGVVKTPEMRAIHAERMRKYRKMDPERFRDIDLKKKYGVGVEFYNEKLKEQNGKCAICGVKEGTIGTGKFSNGRLCVDHVHDETDRIRGLLCTNCNLGIGSFRDDIDKLWKAIEYLLKYAPTETEH